MIEVHQLVKDFGTIRAVDHVSFTVPKGQVLGFLGPNGAGKSTTMKMLTCFINPTSGTARVGGKDIAENAIEVRKQIGYLPENAPLYGEMTVCEFLEFIAQMRFLPDPKRAALAMRETCALKTVWQQNIDTLSKGYKQRVGFAQALIHDPSVLILDEPTDGLDPNQKHAVRQLIKQMGKDKTIIISTHILEEVEAICERAIIIAQGKIVADDNCESLIARSEFHNAVTIRSADQVLDKIKSATAGHPAILRTEKITGESALRLYATDRKSIIGEVSHLIAQNHLTIDHISVERGRFDEVFRNITLNNIAKGE